MITIASRVPLTFITLGTELQINGQDCVCTKAYSDNKFTHPYVYEFGRA